MRKIIAVLAILGVGFTLGAAHGDGKAKAGNPGIILAKRVVEPAKRASWVASGNVTAEVDLNGGGFDVTGTAEMSVQTKTNGSVAMTMTIQGVESLEGGPVEITILFAGKKD